MMAAVRGTRIPQKLPGRDAVWLVTGATGMIGPSIVDDVVGSGARVRVLTRHTSPPPGGWPWRSDDDRVEVVRGDVRDAATLRTSMSGVDVVVHAAGVAHRRPRSRSAVQAFTDENVNGARSVAEVASAVGVSRVVFISSAAVYGAGNGHARDETARTRPTTAYGRSKLESEQVMKAILGDGLTVLRVCAVYGPRLRGQYGTLARAVRSRWPIPVIEGRGHCLITDDDFARVVTQTALDPDAGGAVFNVSDGRIYTVSEIVAALREVTGAPRWRTPILPGHLGTVGLHLLGLFRGREWTRRRQVSLVVRSLVRGPALDAAALRRLLPGLQCQSVVDGWVSALSRQSSVT